MCRTLFPRPCRPCRCQSAVTNPIPGHLPSCLKASGPPIIMPIGPSDHYTPSGWRPLLYIVPVCVYVGMYANVCVMLCDRLAVLPGCRNHVSCPVFVEQTPDACDPDQIKQVPMMNSDDDEWSWVFCRWKYLPSSPGWTQHGKMTGGTTVQRDIVEYFPQKWFNKQVNEEKEEKKKRDHARNININ